MFETTSDQILTNLAELSVGNASDVLVSLQCTGDETATSLFWFQRSPDFVLLPTPLVQTTTSYNPATGLLHVSSAYLQDSANNTDMVSLLCFRNRVAVRVDLILGKTIADNSSSMLDHSCNHF